MYLHQGLIDNIILLISNGIDDEKVDKLQSKFTFFITYDCYDSPRLNL